MVDPVSYLAETPFRYKHTYTHTHTHTALHMTHIHSLSLSPIHFTLTPPSSLPPTLSHFMSVPELRAFSQYFAVSKEQVGAPLIFNSPRKHSYSRSSTSKASVKAGKILGGSEYATWGDMKINIATRNDMRSKPCSKFILIIEGRVSIYSGSKRLCTKTAGQFIPMVNEVDRPLLCKCVTDCVLISMSEEVLMCA
jgi:hypothetical protein